MNWSKVKTIMIILFLFINIFLVYNLFVFKHESTTINAETLDDTVEILRNNAIIIDKSIIPTKMEDLPLLEMENSEQRSDVLAEKILGKEYTEEKDGQFYYYSSGSKRLNVRGCEFNYVDETPSDPIEFLSSETAESSAREYLKGLNISTKHMVLKEINALEDGLYSVTFYQQFGGRLIFEDYVTIVIGPEGVTSMWGYLLVPREFSRQNLSIRQITGILIDFVRNEDRPKGRTIHIENISLGYRVDRSKTDIKETSAFPVWRITTDDCEDYYYEATTGRYISNQSGAVLNYWR